LAALFRFLGFAWEAHWFDRAFSHEHGTGDGDLKVGFSQQIKRDSIGKGAAIPLVYLPEALQAKANRLLVELGYPTLGSAPEVIPVPAMDGAVSTAAKPMAERVKGIFAKEFPAAIHQQQERFQTLNAKCQFIVSGVAEGHWIIDLTSREPAAQVRTGQEDADCTIAVSAPVLIELVEGKLNPIEAYEARKIGGSGNVDLAIKFGQLLLGQ
jgi:protein-tyrosine sulfotransferase